MNPTVLLVFIFAALTIFAIVKVVAPFLEDRDEQLRFEILDEELRQIEELVARKSVMLQSLRDIEFDYETGKLSEADYERLRKKHERQAVQVMRRLDELRGDVDLDDEIDSALEQRLRQRAGAANAETETDTPDESETTLECPECGKQLEAEARFCSRCGHQLADEDDTAETFEGDDESTSVEADLDDDADASGGADEDLSETGGDPSDRSVSDLRSEATG